jgi:hypothetical protein
MAHHRSTWDGETKASWELRGVFSLMEQKDLSVKFGRENAGRSFRRSETRLSLGLTPFRHPTLSPPSEGPAGDEIRRQASWDFRRNFASDPDEQKNPAFFPQIFSHHSPGSFNYYCRNRTEDSVLDDNIRNIMRPWTLAQPVVSAFVLSIVRDFSERSFSGA